MRDHLRLRRRPSYATVTSCLALFGALATGAAYAADTVFSSDIKDGEVRTQDLADHAVTNPKLAFDAVTSSRIRDNAIQTQDIGEHQITNRNLALDSVTASKVLDNTLTGTDIQEATLSPVPDALKLGGLPPTAYLKDATGSVDTGNVLDGTVTGSDLAPGAITTSRVKDESLTGDHIDESTLGTVASTARLAGQFVSLFRARTITGGGPSQAPVSIGSRQTSVAEGTEAVIASFGPAGGAQGELRGACTASSGSSATRFVNTGTAALEVWVDSGGSDPALFDLGGGESGPGVASPSLDLQSWHGTRSGPNTTAPSFDALVFARNPDPGDASRCLFDVQVVDRG